MSQRTINQGPRPDVSSLESLWVPCMHLEVLADHTGQLLSTDIPRAASWLMAKWRIKHLWVEDQKGTGRKELKCLSLLEVVPLNNAHFSLITICLQGKSPQCNKCPHRQIILSSWATSPSKLLRKTCNLSLWLSSVEVLSFTVCFLTPSPTLTEHWVFSLRNPWDPAASLQRIFWSWRREGEATSSYWTCVTIKRDHIYSR